MSRLYKVNFKSQFYTFEPHFFSLQSLVSVISLTVHLFWGGYSLQVLTTQLFSLIHTHSFSKLMPEKATADGLKSTCILYMKHDEHTNYYSYHGNYHILFYPALIVTDFHMNFDNIYCTGTKGWNEEIKCTTFMKSKEKLVSQQCRAWSG